MRRKIGGGIKFSKKPSRAFRLGKTAFALSLVVILAAVVVSISSLFMPFMSISESFANTSVTEHSPIGLAIIQNWLNSPIIEDVLISDEMHAAAALYIALLLSCIISLIFTLAKLGDYNKKQALQVAAINILTAVISIALMIVYLSVSSKVKDLNEDGTGIKTQSFTVAVALLNILFAAASTFLFVCYRDDQFRTMGTSKNASERINN